MSAVDDQESPDATARRRIKAWMAARQISQAFVAERIGQKQAWFSRYLAGEFNTDLTKLHAIAAVFGKTLSDLFDSPADPEVAMVAEMFAALPSEARATVRQLLWLLSRRDKLEKATRSPDKPTR